MDLGNKEIVIAANTDQSSERTKQIQSLPVHSVAAIFYINSGYL